MKRLVFVLALLFAALGAAAQSAAENDLIRASIIGDLDLAMQSLAKGAKVETRVGMNRTPLLLAAKMGHTPLVIIYLDKGALLENVDDEGATTLMMAARSGHFETVQVILSK